MGGQGIGVRGSRVRFREESPFSGVSVSNEIGWIGLITGLGLIKDHFVILLFCITVIATLLQTAL